MRQKMTAENYIKLGKELRIKRKFADAILNHTLALKMEPENWFGL